MTKEEALLKQFQEALARLQEILREPKSDVARDAAIKRFEFTFDIAWKALKEVLEEYYNARCASPQKCFREAYKQGLISFDEEWIELARNRNLTAHTYDENVADEVYALLPKSAEKFGELLASLQRKHD